jgi:hypothetical protein
MPAEEPRYYAVVLDWHPCAATRGLLEVKLPVDVTLLDRKLVARVTGELRAFHSCQTEPVRADVLTGRQVYTAPLAREGSLADVTAFLTVIPTDALLMTEEVARQVRQC